MDKKARLQAMIDKLDQKLGNKSQTMVKSEKQKKIEQFVAELVQETDTKDEFAKTRDVIRDYFSRFLTKLSTIDRLVEAIKNTKVVIPDTVTVKNLKDIPKTILKLPEDVNIRKAFWMGDFVEDIKKEIKQLGSTLQNIKLPKGPKNGIPVRLTDGEEFYKAVADITVQGQNAGGGGSVPKITLDGGTQAVPIVNPDGSTIAGGSGSAAYSDSGGTDRKGLVDADRHVQVDVLTMPAVSVDTTGLATSAKQDTMIGHVDGIETVLGTIDADTGGILTAVQTLDNAISGNEMQVDVVTMPTTTVVGSVASEDADSGNPVKVGATYNSTMPTYTNGDRTDLQAGSRGELKVNIYNGSQVVDFTADNADDAAVSSVSSKLKVVSRNTVFDGTTWDRMRGDSTDGVLVNLGSNNDVSLNAGTNAIGKLAANSGVDIGDVDVTSVIPGTGATNLGKAADGSSNSTDTGVAAFGLRHDTPNDTLAGTDYDYTFLSLYKTGALRTAIPEEDFAALGSNHVKKYYTSTGAATDGIIWSPAAGKRWYVTDIFINVSAAATVTLEDDLAAGDAAVWKAELAANSGWSHHFGTPLFSGEDAADLLITTSAGNVYVTVTGYEI